MKPLSIDGTSRSIQQLQFFRLPPKQAGAAAESRGPQDQVDFGPLAPEAGTEPIRLTTDANGQPRRVSSVGFNPPYHCTLSDGSPGVFKAIPSESKWSEQSWRDEMAREVVASKLMKAFVPNGLEYRAAGCVQEGLKGVSCELLDITPLSKGPDLVKEISNPDQAIAGGVVDAWLGNYDRIENDGNVWVKSQDKSVIFGDYGCAFHPGVKVLGLPKVNARLFQTHASPERVEPTLDKIRNLSDNEIAKMVSEAGKDCPFLRPEVEKSIVDVLVKNRDELRKENPFAAYYDGKKPVGQVSGSMTEALIEGLRAQNPGSDGHQLSLRAVAKIRGRVGSEDRDRKRVAALLSNALEVSRSQVFHPIPVFAEDLVAWRGLLKNNLPQEQQKQQQEELGFLIS